MTYSQLTEDGSITLFSEKFNETYHSRKGALTESLHVFIETGLKYKSLEKKEIKIGEIGLGTGLNAILSLEFAQKTGLGREDALFIVNLVKTCRVKTATEKTSGLRSCLMIAKVCASHDIVANSDDADFRDICADVLLSRTSLPIDSSRAILWEILDDNLVESLSVGDEEEPSDAQASTSEPSTGNQSIKAIQSLLRTNLLKQKD
jgi:hypothetical protein